MFGHVLAATVRGSGTSNKNKEQEQLIVHAPPFGFWI